VLFPPSVPKDALQPRKGECDHEGISWFANVLPRTKAKDWPHARPIEFVQEAGETVFIPGGWHHVVLNITDTVAATQNFCSPTNFHIVWRRTVKGRPKLSKRWLRRLKVGVGDGCAWRISCRCLSLLAPHFNVRTTAPLVCHGH
jgi:histone arginine demethylase JMJD6